MAKNWQSRPPRGKAVLLPEVLALAAGPDPGTAPRISRTGSRIFVHYSRTRVYLDRGAWEALAGPEDVLVQRVCPSGEPAYTIALTRAELERVFGEVRDTRSWDDVRCYHFPVTPPAVDSFRVRPSSSSAPPLAGRLPAQPRTPAPKAQPVIPQTKPSIAGWAAEWARRLGGTAESSAYLTSVAAWRDAWRPARVRVLLVAESHVAEEPSDGSVRVHLPGAVPERLPSSYCRLVYCLGYGENALCTPAPVRNQGTPQFWDIFGAIAGGTATQQPRKDASTLPDRLRWKIDVLRWLRDQGAWLVDACVAGVYRPGGGRAASGADYNRMVRESYEQLVWPTVAAEPIEQVWVIGAGVAGALRGHPSMARAQVIIQPQGDRGAPGRHHQELRGLVTSVRAIVPSR